MREGKREFPCSEEDKHERERENEKATSFQETLPALP
jgi:hypothetical protein